MILPKTRLWVSAFVGIISLAIIIPGTTLIGLSGYNFYKNYVAVLPQGNGNSSNATLESITGPQVLAATDDNTTPKINFNAVSLFNKITYFNDNIEAPGKQLNLGDGTIIASNVIYSLTAGNGIQITGGQNPTISASVPNFTAGSGISVGTGANPTLTNTGVISLAGKSGALELEEGDGISIDDLEITNDDKGSSQSIFKNFAITGQNTVTAGSNNDTLTLIAGTGITLATDSTNKSITINGSAAAASGWTIDDGTTQQTIASGNTLTVSDSTTINAAVSAADTLTYNVIANSIDTSHLAASLAFADGDLINLSSVNVSGTTEGLILPQTTSCASGTAEGQICWDSDTEALYVGNGTGATLIGGTGGGDITAIGDVLTGDAFTQTAGNDGTTLYFEGATADTNEIALTTDDPGSDITVTIPSIAGTLASLAGTQTFTGAKTFDDLTIADTNISLSGASTTFTSTGAFTLTPGGAVILGDGGDTMDINTSDWDISTTGALTGISGITTDGAYTQSGSSANTFTGASTLSGGATVSRTLAANSGATQDVLGITFTTPADGSGTNVNQGISITPTIGNATAGTNTANIFNIGAVAGDAQVTLNAINIGALTGTAATEYALNIGSGWDSILRVNGTEVINGSGQVAAGQVSGTLFSTDSDSASANAIARGDTLTINGDSNGIDVTHSGDTMTVAFDGTEVGAETWGSGSGFTWTFDAGATDPTLAFASNQLTIGGAATLTATDVTDFDCTDCIDYDDISDSLTLDAATSLAQGANAWTQSFTGTTTTGYTYTASSLTSGTAALYTTAASAFTGNLFNITSTGNNASNTGTLFRVGTSGASDAVTTAMVTNLGTGTSFRVNDETGDSDSSPFIIDNAGNVGIGTASPGHPLAISRALNASILLEADNDSSVATAAEGAYIRFRYSGSYYGFFGNSTLADTCGNNAACTGAIQNAMYLAAPNGNAIQFGTGTIGNATTRLTIVNGGSIGIGDTSPDHLLDVAGNIGLDASGYINWGDTDGTTGYGLRDNAGTIEYKNSGGSWKVVGSTTLQEAYDNDADGSNTTISLTTADDSLIITNPTSSGTDSAYLLFLNQQHTTGAVSALDITQASNNADAVNLIANSIDTENGLDISTTALTTGSAIKVTSGNSLTTNGELLDLNMAASTAGNGMNVATTGVYTGTGLVVLTANSATTGVGQAISMTGLTTGTGLSITGGSSMAAGGELIDLNMGAATAGNGINIATTGVYTGTGLANLTANSATTGNILTLSATGLTSGTGLSITGGGANMTTNGEVIDVVAGGNTVGAGLRITSTGAYTGTAVTDGLLNITANSLTSGYASQIYTNAITSGIALNISSTSTALTSGRLASLDWSPASSWTATGDLFRINIGSNGNVGNLFNITDNGTSLFAVSETAVTSAVPANFTAAGDVGIAYDLQFTNQTASYIKSNAPLVVEAGESFESNNLTLRSYNSGQIVVDGSLNGTTVTSNTTSTGAGTVTVTGRGTSYYLHDSSGTTNSSYTTTINVTGVPTTEGTIVFMRTACEKGATAGSQTHTCTIQINGTQTSQVATATGTGASTVIENYVAIYLNSSWRLMVGSNTTSDTADLAEVYKAETTVDAAEIVSLTKDEDLKVRRAEQGDGSLVLGVTSTKPAVLIGDEFEAEERRIAVALAGRVPVKVTTENGTINPGDFITISSQPGVGMKATEPGMVVGKALSGYQNSNTSEVGTITMFVQNTYYSPTNTLLASANEMTPDALSSTAIPHLLVSGSAEISDLTVTGQFLAGNLSITGMAQDSGADISTLTGPLRLQPDAGNNVEIMGGKVIIDTDGNIIADEGTLSIKTVTAKKINIDNADVTDASIGTSKINAWETSVTVNTTAVTENSQIFVTAKSKTRQPLAVTATVSGESFTVEIPEEQEEDLTFSWWIIN